MIYTYWTEDQQEAKRLVRATNAYASLWDMDLWLRDEIKHKNRDLQDVRDQLWEIMELHGINLDEEYT